jgi:hypothetical protein
MDEEITQLEGLGTYQKEELPQGRVAIEAKWVYQAKRDTDGNVICYKARLVAKGYSQRPGIDYDKTFAPVMQLETLRLLIAIATQLSLEAHVMDVVGAYLNGKLEETIYMQQPPGYEDGTSMVLRLLLTLYGLKQSGRAWNKTLDRAFTKLGYTRLFSDQCVYFRIDGDKFTIVAVHVDNMLLLATDHALMDQLKKGLASKFKVSDLGELKLMVGMEFARCRERGLIKMSQTQYVTRIIDRFGMALSNPVKTPLDPNIKLAKTPEGTSHHFPKYLNAIGSLMYAAIGTRPDISFAVQHLSQFLLNPGPEHWTAVKQVFCYLNGTKDLGIIFGRSLHPDPIGYLDANWGSNWVDRRLIML